MLVSRLAALLSSYLPCTVSPKHLYLLSLSLLLWKLAHLDQDLAVLWATLTHPPWSLRKFYSGKVVWITGASSGLGRAIAVELAKYPCKLVISARRESELNKVKSECQTNGIDSENILVLPMDSLNFGKLPDLVSEVVERFGTIDILVNNAGRSQRSLAEDTELPVDKAIKELNYFGYVAHTKAVLPTMIANKAGTIVGVSSLTGKMGTPVSTAYAASKHAVMGFLSSLRMELYSYGINVCTVCPGPVRSNISLHSFTEDVTKEYNQDVQDQGKKQEADRFAYLTSVALAARVPESWISIQPYLLITYIAQYLPSVYQSFLVSRAAQKRITKFKNKECLY